MRPRRIAGVLLTVATTVGFTLAAAGAASAGAMYSATMDATITFQGYYEGDTLIAEKPLGLQIGYLTLMGPIHLTDSTGSATAASEGGVELLGSDPNDLGVNEGIRVTSSVAGAVLNPGEISLASFFWYGAIGVGGSEELAGTRLAFDLTYSSAVEATADDPGSIAYAWNTVLLETSDHGSEPFPPFLDDLDFPFLTEDDLASDEIPTPFPFFVDAAHSTLRPGSSLQAGTYSFDVLFNPEGTFVVLQFYNHGDPYGPRAVVPEPSGLVMTTIGIGSLMLYRHRRRVAGGRLARGSEANNPCHRPRHRRCGTG